MPIQATQDIPAGGFACLKPVAFQLRLMPKRLSNRILISPTLFLTPP